uniref:NIDO domain-containing protein n=1 Tax=Lates calcarifer TaxID=8187 RepID=A0A4W6E0Y7_LATCA
SCAVKYTQSRQVLLVVLNVLTLIVLIISMVILFFHFFFLIQHILFFLGPLYPINGIASSQSDDGSSPQISLNRPFVFFGQTYNQIYVNHNGHLTFDAAWSSFSPQMFPMHGSRDIIAPLWVDLDNRENGQVYYNQYNSASVLQQATQDINSYFPWTELQCGLLSNNWHRKSTWSKRGISFQAVLISGGQYSFVLMNYGVIAATSRHIQAGYDTVHSAHHFSIPGSFSSNSSGPDSNFRLSSNVNVAGRWAFRVDRGSTGSTVPVHRSAPAPHQACNVSDNPAPFPKSAGKVPFSSPARQCRDAPAQ